MLTEPSLEDSTSEDLYVVCPRCRGDRTIPVCTRPADGWSERPSQWDEMNCPGCSGVGSTARTTAIELKRYDAEAWAWNRGEELSSGIPDEIIAKAVSFADLPLENPDV